jgi:hypothetical protein
VRASACPGLCISTEVSFRRRAKPRRQEVVRWFHRAQKKCSNRSSPLANHQNRTHEPQSEALPEQGLSPRSASCARRTPAACESQWPLDLELFGFLRVLFTSVRGYEVTRYLSS